MSSKQEVHVYFRITLKDFPFLTDYDFAKYLLRNFRFYDLNTREKIVKQIFPAESIFLFLKELSAVQLFSTESFTL